MNKEPDQESWETIKEVPLATVIWQIISTKLIEKLKRQPKSQQKDTITSLILEI